MTRPIAGGKPWLAGAAKAALLTTAEMYRADAAAIASGVSGPRLMETADFVEGHDCFVEKRPPRFNQK